MCDHGITTSLISSAKLSFPGYFYDNLAELIFEYGEAHASTPSTHR
jgi:hypothetical protein